MGFLATLLARFIGRKSPAPQSDSTQQAVLVYLDGVRLPAQTYAQYDAETIEDRLIEVIRRNRLGEFGGIKVRDQTRILLMHGPDAERLYAGIEQTLRSYPLCQQARVVIRKGGPGAVQREVLL
jgi:hypothetical protein